VPNAQRPTARLYSLISICLVGHTKDVVTASPDLLTVLAEPTRRRILDLLLESPRSVGDLVGELDASQPTTSKHLRVLREAGLVHVHPDAQRRVYALRPHRLAELDAWLAPYRRLWEGRLDALERHLDDNPATPRRTT
jgi:DNA-binding transcriptional ArsR family regulator